MVISKFYRLLFISSLFIISACGGSSSSDSDNSGSADEGGSGEEPSRGGDNPEIDVPSQKESFVNFESTSVSPIHLSSDATKLYAVNTEDNRLSVFDVSNPQNPILEKEIPVGLEPISVMENPYVALPNREVWVANLISDSISSVVDVNAGLVIDILQGTRVPESGIVFDEPSDIVFAQSKAFVTAATLLPLLSVMHSTYSTLLPEVNWQ